MASQKSKATSRTKASSSRGKVLRLRRSTASAQDKGKTTVSAQDKINIGISGWTYAPWRGAFYPEDLPHRRELEYAASRFNSIEINGSFYSLQRPSSYRKWYGATPSGFVFSVKGSRFITHMRRLREVREPLCNFFASGILELREKLGPIFWQFPPNFVFDAQRFDEFFQLLPRTTAEASKLAKQHTSLMTGRMSTRIDEPRPLRYAVEIRHDSFKTPEFIALLRRYRIALVFADAPVRWPYMEDLTADFVYIRMHGAEEIYASGYEAKDLDRWAKRIRLWREGRQPKDGPRVSDQPPRKLGHRDVFVYFDNDKKVRAPVDAAGLSKRLGVDWAERHVIAIK